MASPWPFYLVGTLVVLLGFGVLGRWFQGVIRDREAPSLVVGALVAFVVGGGILAVAMANDSEEIRLETRVFVYRVSVDVNGTSPVRLLLPAPVDARLRFVIDEARGTSTLRAVLVGGAPVVELVTDSDVEFEVRVTAVGAPFDPTLTRVATSDLTTTATLAFSSSGNTTEVVIDLAVEFIEPCLTRSYSLAARLRPGTSVVPMQTSSTPC